MYYKEEWIGRELYWKSSPNGSWVPFTKEQYRERCLRLEAELKKLESTKKTMKDFFALLNPVQNEALLNQTIMKTKVNIPHRNIVLFKQCCDINQVTYTEIEERIDDTRFEIEYKQPSILFYLGAGYGIRTLSQDLTSKK